MLNYNYISPSYRGERYKKSELIFMWFIVGMTAVAGVGRPAIAGFRIQGWAWLLTLAVSSFFLVKNLILGRLPAFKILPWIPFLVYIVIRSTTYDRDELQRIGIMITPLFVALASSTMMVTMTTQARNRLRRAYYGLFLMSFFIYCSLIILSRSIFGGPFFAIAGVRMTWVALATFGIIECGEKNRIGWILILVCFSMAALSHGRMPILVIPTLFVLGPSRLSIRSRLILGMLILAAFLMAFSSEFVQDLVFRWGQRGTLEDIVELDPNVVSSGGRLTMWPEYIKGIQNLWLGQGSTASVEFGRIASGGGWSHPHCEYLRILFDYGIVGIVLLALPIISIGYRCIYGIRSLLSDVSWFNRLALGNILAMLLLGITGNTLMYSAWIGNLAFASIGLAFASTVQNKIVSREYSQDKFLMHKCFSWEKPSLSSSFCSIFK